MPDHEKRNLAIEHFLIEKSWFEARHKEVVPLFEAGRITPDEYLERTVFYQTRSFLREEFQRFMFSLSRPKLPVLEIARHLYPKHFMATINNESRELNQYRIDNFGLTECFQLFVTSCFVGIRKPHERIFRLALDLMLPTSAASLMTER